MSKPAALGRATLIAVLLSLLPGMPGWAQPTHGPALGLCPLDARRLDSYMQAICDGEAAWQAGDLGVAIDRFHAAAALPRADASNELAWAGLAAAHCRARDVDAGRQWAAHFTQARQLWLGELDCAASGDDPRARLSPFVRSRMCTEQLAADYGAVRSNPQSAHASDLRLRLQRIEAAVAAACAMPSAVPAPVQAQAGAKKAAEATKDRKAPKKRSSRANRSPKPR